MQGDPKDDDSNLAGNDIELTDAERAAREPEKPTGEEKPPVTEAVAEQPAKEGEVPVAKVEEPAPEAAAPAAAETSAAPQALSPLQLQTSGRDYDKELTDLDGKLKELKQKYNGGDSDLSDEDYEQQYEALQELKSDLKAERSVEKVRAEVNQAAADQSWAFLQRQFLSETGSATIRASTYMMRAWEQAMQDVVNEAASESKSLTDWDIMVGGRQKLIDAGVLSATAPTAATTVVPPIEQPKPDRTSPAKDVPTSLGQLPAAADAGSKSTVETLAGNDIEDVESWLAGKSEAERDKLLREVPGAFVDN